MLKNQSLEIAERSIIDLMYMIDTMARATLSPPSIFRRYFVKVIRRQLPFLHHAYGTYSFLKGFLEQISIDSLL